MRNLMRIVISTSIVAGLSAGALADDKAKPAPPTPPAKPTPPPTPPKKDDKPAPPPTTPPAAQMPTPPAEVATMVKAMTGTWKCTGKVFMPGGEMPIKSTMKTRFALDKFWSQSSYAETKKKGYKFEAYRTFDGKKWHDITIDNMGGHSITSSDGPKDGKTVWTGTAADPMMGEHMVKHTEEPVGTTGKEMHVFGEYSMDKGKTWTKGYDASCKK